MIKICHMTVTNMTSIPRLRREAHSAVFAGMECCIVAPGDCGIDNGVEMIGVPLPCSRKERIIKTDKEVLKKALESGADIIQIHDPELLRYAGKLKQRNKTVIFDSHEFYGLQIMVKTYIPKVFRKLVANIYMAYEKYVCLRIDGVIYVCTVNGKNYFQGRAKNSIELANYPEFAAFSQNMGSFENCKGKTRCVIYAGALTADRGITNLALAARHAGTKLVLCGAFASNDYKNKILTEFADDIDYKGVLSTNNLTSEYAKAGVGMSTLLPVGQYGLIDTYPTKVLEYCWMAIPVIVSDFPFLKKFVEQYHCGLCVDPENVDDIESAIKYLMDNPEEARQMGLNGRKAVEQEFNWATQEKRLLELYEELTEDIK